MSAATITRRSTNGRTSVDVMGRTNAYHRSVLWSWAQLKHIAVDMEDDVAMPLFRVNWHVLSLTPERRFIVGRNADLTEQGMRALWNGAAQGFAIEMLSTEVIA
jgi:hypothetical protein